MLLAALVGCSDTPNWGAWSTRPTYSQLQTVRGIEAIWVYYPAYRIYYSSNHQQYVCWDATKWETGAWETGIEPLQPVTEEMLKVSPSVKMTFHDSPILHHVEVAALYPTSWSPQEAMVALGTGN